MADVIRIDTLYFAQALNLRLQRRALIRASQYKAGFQLGTKAEALERTGLKIRAQMAEAPAQPDWTNFMGEHRARQLAAQIVADHGGAA